MARALTIHRVYGWLLMVTKSSSVCQWWLVGESGVRLSEDERTRTAWTAQRSQTWPVRTLSPI